MACKLNRQLRSFFGTVLLLNLLFLPALEIFCQSKRPRSVGSVNKVNKKISPVVPLQPIVQQTIPAPTKPVIPEPQKPVQPKKVEPKEEEAILRIDSKLVAVPVSVTDTAGEPIKGLKPEDFKLFEEGSPQQLVALGDPGQTPVELVLVFDASGSVFERFKFQQDAAARFLKQVFKPKDSVTIFSIGMTSHLIQPRTLAFDQSIAGLMKIVPTREGTAFFDTVADAAKYLGKNAEPGTRHVIIVISDGEDNKSDDYRLPSAIQELQRSDCLFYSINPSGPSIRLNRVSMRGQDGMMALAKQTGGAAFLPDKFEDLDLVFKQIATELQAQYLLGYYSTDDRSDGGFRKIAVNVPARPELRVRARQGYYAPKV